MQDSDVRRVKAYHALSKHRPDRYAPGPGGLDWSSQPDPFRRFTGAPKTDLPLDGEGPGTLFSELCRPNRTNAAAVDLRTIGRLFELSLGLSAWKNAGLSRWALRCNPSSGNLHPTEAYLLCPELDGIAGGVHHYLSHDHLLEQRAAISDPHWETAFRGNLVLGLSSIHWREAWKYGARAFRYCQHDLGHAVAAIAYAAASLGWGARILQQPGSGDIERILGLDRTNDFYPAESETADVLVGVGPNPQAIDIDPLLDPPPKVVWHGRANRLSGTHRDWPQIGEAAHACRKPPGTVEEAYSETRFAERKLFSGSLPAGQLFRNRRSAVAFDGRTLMPAEAFFAILDALLPRRGIPPWSALPWRPLAHLFLFVHRVQGLESGLYALPRTPDVREEMQAAMREEWLWKTVDGCPSHLPLRLLMPGDFREAAKIISCHQDIAADSAFSLGMLSEFDRPIQDRAWRYPRLFWETGVVGQALYIEAEAAGFRGTGIGCFFDDSMHQLLGLNGDRWQDLYHFTVGTPVEDLRLMTEPPYAHLPEHRRG